VLKTVTHPIPFLPKHIHIKLRNVDTCEDRPTIQPDSQIPPDSLIYLELSSAVGSVSMTCHNESNW
jgi:hypothetical protein